MFVNLLQRQAQELTYVLDMNLNAIRLEVTIRFVSSHDMIWCDK